ncbi:hypothetical protein D3C87_29180 [compost metagenome]
MINSNNELNKRKINWALIFMLSTFLAVAFLFGFRQIAMLSTAKACGKVVNVFRIKGHQTFEIEFNFKGKTQVSKVSSQAFKIKEYEKLKKYDCVQIEYSIHFPSYIRVEDTVVGSGQGW